MSMKQILKYSVCFAVFAVVICIQPAISDPSAGHWVFLAASVVFLTACFHLGLLLIAKYKSSHR